MSTAFCFQAEDGIRDGHVTGVQTCALPISLTGRTPAKEQDAILREDESRSARREIGRASCRERVGVMEVSGRVEKIRRSNRRRVSLNRLMAVGTRRAREHETSAHRRLDKTS